MGLARKLRIGWAVLLSDGPRKFLNKVWSNLKLVFRRNLEPDECDIVYHTLKKLNRLGVMIDVGAHYGSALDKFAVDGWRVIAFEPDSKNRDKLHRAYDGFANVSIDPRGISDKKESDVPFYDSSESSGISGLLAFDQSHTPAGVISTTTLAHVIREFDLDEISFLKIDTEGLDLLVLRGLPVEAVPDVIICEFEDRKTEVIGYSYKDLAQELENRQYTIILSEWYPVEKYGQTHQWRRAVQWPAEILDRNAWGNFIAVRNSDLANQMLQAFPEAKKFRN